MSAGPGDRLLGTTDTACVPAGKADCHYENNCCISYQAVGRIKEDNGCNIFFLKNAKSCITVKNYIIVGSTSEGPFWKVLYSS